MPKVFVAREKGLTNDILQWSPFNFPLLELALLLLRCSYLRPQMMLLENMLFYVGLVQLLAFIGILVKLA